MIALAFLAPGAALAQPACVAPAAAKPGVEQTIRAYFDALAKDDAPGAAALTSPGYYAYDVGERFTAATLSATITEAHKSGVTLVWNLGEFDVHPSCDTAWAAWVNRGSVTRGGQTLPMVWLESAVLRHAGGRWVVEFLHSTRAPPKP